MSSNALHAELKGRRVLIAGAGGQLGIALQKQMPADVELFALDRNGLNITDASSVTRIVTRLRPDWIINAAAYTDVDKAEAEAALAMSINRDGASNLARAAESINARMVQISTDYVFDGCQTRPYRPDDPVNPVNVYGESKLAGENATREILGERLLILRTAWVYSPHGRNFLTTMLRLIRERDELCVVEDQIGTPSSALRLADAILTGIAKDITGIHHWTDAGVTSWYDFACAIQELAGLSGFVFNPCHIVPIPTSEYPTPARRPAYSVLDKSTFRKAAEIEGLQWRQALQQEISRTLESGQ